MSDPLRLYAPDDCGPDGYPRAWHETIKHLVRELAGHRCIRCGHPYRNGEHGPRGQWSACDEQCRHFGPGRHDPQEPDFRAAVPEGYPPIIDSDGWVYFDNGDIEWLISHGHVVESEYRILTVHHLDGDKLNCRWFNLMAACQRCHLEVQRRVRMNRPWPWEHTAWMKPYAAGFYALKYLGLDLTREETEARLDELLEMGRCEESVERMPL